MADVRYSFQDSTKVQAPNWMSPESNISHCLYKCPFWLIWYLEEVLAVIPLSARVSLFVEFID